VASERPNELMYLPRVVSAETLAAVKRLDLRQQSIADRWASTSPQSLRQLEKEKKLLERLNQQASVEAAAISDARTGGRNSDVPDSEILELAGIDLDP
jgi:hypothetical protein